MKVNSSRLYSFVGQLTQLITAYYKRIIKDKMKNFQYDLDLRFAELSVLSLLEQINELAQNLGSGYVENY